MDTDEEDTSHATLEVVSGTCIKDGLGDFDVYATVTVTDACGVEYEIGIKNSDGHWERIDSCGKQTGDAGTVEWTDGEYKYWENHCCSDNPEVQCPAWEECSGCTGGSYGGGNPCAGETSETDAGCEGWKIYQWTC